MEPLAVRLRPKTIADIIGQDHLLGPNGPIRKFIETKKLPNIILFGGPGIGKTTIAECIANDLGVRVFKFNATTFAVKALREAISTENPIIFIDEIARLTQPQSDVLLPHLESGRVTLIGAAIANPYHSLQSAIISRCLVYELKQLDNKALAKLTIRAIKYLNLDRSKIDKEAIKYLISVSNGDGRKLLSILDTSVHAYGDLKLDSVKIIAPSQYAQYTLDNKYDWASALQGSIQASDVDSAIYWLACWLESGEDPRYIARRILVSASEDASSSMVATVAANNAYVAACTIGRPECDLVLAHAVVAIATAKRDKSAAIAIWNALKDIRENGVIEVPKEMKDCHYPGAEKLGHGVYHDGMNQKAYIGINKEYYKPW